MDNITESKRIMLSGIKPTGDLTLGSYLGAIKNWAERAEQFDCYYFMADLHALTTRNTPADLRRRTLEQLAQYIACGLDPQRNTLFLQSDVHEHAELGWILNCYTMFGELSRMTQFKDKSSKNADNINGGLFTYPALMAADILLYQADVVPVGKDQLQHLELTRDIANRFNSIYGDVFTIPEPYIGKVGAKIMSLQDPSKKMSKSDENPNASIYLMDDPDTIRRKCKRAITDSEATIAYRDEQPGLKNLFDIYCTCTGKTAEEAVAEFQGQGYGQLKEAVGEAVVSILKPMQDRMAEIAADKSYLDKVIKENAERAYYSANKTLRKVKKKIGLTEMPR